MTVAETLRGNKAFLVFGLLAIVVSGLVIRPAPALSVPYPVLVLPDGTVINTATYPHLDAVQIGLFNWFRDLFMSLATEDFTGLPTILTHYFIAFVTYAMATLFETTPGYRTEYYRAWHEQMIAKMNSSFVENQEWNSIGFNNVTLWGQLAGFRGPANIMWTGHYALMMALYERFFRNNKYNVELQSYLDQFEYTMTHTQYGVPNAGGLWNCGLIACEPYIVFVQCNSIPQWTLFMTDSLWNTSRFDVCDYGINWIMTNMTDDHGCFVDGYYMTELPEEWHYMTERYRGIGPSWLPPPANHTAENSYGIGWALMLYDSYRPAIVSQMYPKYVNSYVRHMYPDSAYVMGAYSYPGNFGIVEMLGSTFGIVCSKEVGDWALQRKLMNYVFTPWPLRWNGYRCYFDSSALGAGLGGLLMMLNSFFYIWATTPVLMKNLATPRPASFFDEPYISSTTGNGLFVHQAVYDPATEVFVLTVTAHEASTLMFSNFPGVQGIQSASGPIPADWWLQVGNQMLLQLPAGVWNLAIY